MVIGVISDTHIPKRAKELPGAVLETFRGADHIIHAGDIMAADVIAQLAHLAPVTAVAGNLDPPELLEKLGHKNIITLDHLKIGVCHGHGEKGSTVKRALECFGNDRVDCIVFGHSHKPLCTYSGGVLLFNPGSPTDKRTNRFYSVGMIEWKDAVLRPRIVYFDSEGKIL